jgi:hypothetical protein
VTAFGWAILGGVIFLALFVAAGLLVPLLSPRRRR